MCKTTQGTALWKGTKNMASESAMIKLLKSKVSKLPKTCIKKLWSSHVNRDIDILVVTHGIACFYEIKIPGEQPTAWQYNQLAKWAASGAVTGWYDDVNELVADILNVPASFNLQVNLLREHEFAAEALRASKK